MTIKPNDGTGMDSCKQIILSRQGQRVKYDLKSDSINTRHVVERILPTIVIVAARASFDGSGSRIASRLARCVVKARMRVQITVQDSPSGGSASWTDRPNRRPVTARILLM